MTTRQPTSLGCFLCGKDNAKGMHLHWLENREEKYIYCDTTVSEEYRSYPGIVHGGIVAALLDETAGRAVLLDQPYENLMVTLKLEVVYKKATPTNTQLRIVGRVIKGTSSRASVEGEIRLPDGSVTAKATAIVLKPPMSMLDGSKEENEEWARTSPAK